MVASRVGRHLGREGAGGAFGGEAVEGEEHEEFVVVLGEVSGGEVLGDRDEVSVGIVFWGPGVGFVEDGGEHVSEVRSDLRVSFGGVHQGCSFRARHAWPS